MPERRTLTQVAYEQIKERMEENQYAGYLNAHKVARELEIGYTPVREALLRLQSEGLVHKVENAGFFVHKVELEELLRIFQVRECIELYVWNQAFDRLGDEQINQMLALNEQEMAMYKQGNAREFPRIDIKLHGVILDFYGNADLNTLYYNVRQRYLLCPAKTVREGSRDAIDEHGLLLEKVKQRDKEGAIHLLETHINNTKTRMKEGYITFLE